MAITYKDMVEAGFKPLFTTRFYMHDAMYKAMASLATAEFEIYEKSKHGGYQNKNRLHTCFEGILAELAAKQYLERQGHKVTPHGLIKRTNEMKQGKTIKEGSAIGDIECNGEQIEVKSVPSRFTPAQIMPRYAKEGKRIMCAVVEKKGDNYRVHIVADCNNVTEWPIMPNNSQTCDCYTMPFIYELAGK